MIEGSEGHAASNAEPSCTYVSTGTGRPMREALEHVVMRISERPQEVAHLLAGAPEAMIAFDANRRILHANRCAEQLFGHDPGALDGMSIDALVPERFRQPQAPPMMPTEGIVQVDQPGLRRDGTELAVEWVFRSVHGPANMATEDETEDPVFVMAVRDRDAVERELDALRASEEWFRLLAEGVVREYAIFMLAPDGRVSSWNAGAQRSNGWSAREILGKPFDVLFTPEDRAAGVPQRRLATAVRDGNHEMRIWHLRKDGTRFFASAHLTALRSPSGELRGFAQITRDLTERLRAEDAERRLSAERAGREAAEAAEQRVRASEERLRQARAEAEAASRAKDEFLAMLGHELRNPLSPIVTALHLMKLRDGDVFRQERTVIERQVTHLLRLVDDLLDISRITRGKIQLRKERLEIAQVVAKAIELSSPLLEQGHHHLSITVPDHGLALKCDATRLAQVVSNLLNNAAKYTPPGGRIEITASRCAGRIMLTVRDNGIGISPAMLPRVFEPFAQERQDIDRSQGGLGLGLAIVKSLVAMHDGTVSVFSEGHGKGSTFTVELPFAAHRDASEPPTPVPPSAQHRSGTGQKVLVVDDNVDAAEMLAELLRASGYATSIAPDGPVALEIARTFRPDIALVDIGLPVMDGYELARRLRGMLDDVRLIAVTGYGQQCDRDRSREAGFDDHLVKPVSPDVLHAALQSSLFPDDAARSSVRRR